jgi:hypothetical protein
MLELTKRRAGTLWRSLLAADPDYALAGRLFLRALAVVYLAAFVSAAREITGLVGEQGLLPASAHLQALWQTAGPVALLRFPTIFWVDASDTSLLLASYLGCVFAVLLLLGWRPLLSTVALFLLYLSIYRVGQLFFNFQWDYLLLEAGFLAVLLAMAPSRLVVFLFHWLLFRLRFLSGLSKVLSGDPNWSGLTALNHYFETQPLPHVGAWYAHQLPTPVLQFGTGFTLFAELLVPFFIFLPRPWRLAAAAITIFLQLTIIATSNHNFINLLTIALCLFLIDDRALRALWPWRRRAPPAAADDRRASRWAGFTQLAVAGAILFASLAGGFAMATGHYGEAPWHAPVNWIRGWGLGNAYHVFPTMQTERQELVVEGSHDGQAWQRYDFRYKPDAPTDDPVFTVPLHPRLDWMMWFVPTQNPAMRFWFERLMSRLHENSPAVTALLGDNPFANRPPRYLRVVAFRYRFTSAAERARSGNYWHAEPLGLFPQVPPRRP